jgi:hypothetical protein
MREIFESVRTRKDRLRNDLEYAKDFDEAKTRVFNYSGLRKNFLREDKKKA